LLSSLRTVDSFEDRLLIFDLGTDCDASDAGNAYHDILDDFVCGISGLDSFSIESNALDRVLLD